MCKTQCVPEGFVGLCESVSQFQHLEPDQKEFSSFSSTVVSSEESESDRLMLIEICVTHTQILSTVTELSNNCNT